MSQREVSLTKSDYSDIRDAAQRLWLDKAIKDEYNHNTMCIVQAFIDSTISKKLIVKDGKVYKNEEENVS